MLEVLLLIKGYQGGKKRLGEFLSEQQRADLIRAMFFDVLDQLNKIQANIYVLSSCEQVKADVANFGAIYIDEPEGLANMNQAAAYGECYIAERAAKNSRLLILHADIPLIHANDILALQAIDASYVIATDEQQDGSNAFLKPFDGIEYRYGAGSCSAHSEFLTSSGKGVAVVQLDSLQWDVDTIGDLQNCIALHESKLPCYGSAKHSVEFWQQEEITCLLKDRDFLRDRVAFDSFVSSIPSNEADLIQQASLLRDKGFASLLTYSPKVFIPLTHLCRDVCHYCTFTKTPKQLDQMYMSEQQVLELVLQGEQQGCHEALLTLGEKPELRFKAARDALAELGFSSTLEYVAHIAKRITEETGLLPHINAGNMNPDEIAMLRPFSASMGIMLESVSTRLCEKGQPHYGSPDKRPETRLKTIALAGEMKVPFTTGILIGIGETRQERLESLWAIYELHQQYGHIQEIIIQNFRAKTDTLMAESPEPNLAELLWTIAVSRLMFGAKMSIQVPPNLSPGELEKIVAAGINDWGGVSPITPDHVNPEAPWPHIQRLADETAAAGKQLVSRLTIYPSYIEKKDLWLDKHMHAKVLSLIDGSGLPREDDWLTGSSTQIPGWPNALLDQFDIEQVNPEIKGIVNKALSGDFLQHEDIVRLLGARQQDFTFVCQSADLLREQQVGDEVAYVVNRNINYTNVCYFKCKFCAFSKGKTSEELRGKPYDLSETEIKRRVAEAWQRGATEVCMQGGIHPDYTGETYKQIVKWVKQEQPQMHVHAFSPLEVWQGAATTNSSLEAYLSELKELGLSTLPGTAAEILDDDIRAIICPDKINTEQWLEVMRTAHMLGIKTTATIMFGHVEQYRHIANHLIRIRDLQLETSGFTEFVPLPFVAAESPVYLRGLARKGPTLRESVLMHAVARLALGAVIPNIQASWVKMGQAGVQLCLRAGANDLGGTLMNESITRAAGASHGEEMSPELLEQWVIQAERKPKQRTTLYNTPIELQMKKSYGAEALEIIDNTPIKSSRKARDVA